jgi:hypothetical protein
MTNGTAVFIAVCLGVLAVEMTLVLVAMAVLVLRVSRAVRSVERVALQVEDKFASIRTSWMRVLQGAGGVLSGFWGGRKHARTHARIREEEERLAHAER